MGIEQDINFKNRCLDERIYLIYLKDKIKLR